MGHSGHRSDEQDGCDASSNGKWYHRGFFGRIIPRLLHLLLFFKRPMTLGVRAAAFDAKGRIFLVRHTYVPGWHLPGGGVEKGQTVFDALERELAEEGNLQQSGQAQLFNVYLNATSHRDHIVLFVCRDVVQVKAHVPDWEIAEAGFFALDALPADTTSATKRCLAELSSQAEPSQRW